MQGDINSNQTEQAEKGAKDKAAWHRRRIKRMKITIVVLVIILLILPTLFCIFLGLKVSRLQNQVEELVRIHMEETGGFANVADEDGSYAYAAERNRATEQASPTDQGAEDKEQVAGDKELIAGENDQITGDKEQNTGENEQTAEGKEQSAEGAVAPVIAGTPSTGIPLSGIPIIGIPVSGVVLPNIPTADASTTNTETTTDNEQKDIKQEPDVMKELTGEAKPKEEEAQKESTGIYAGKKVYLTFDDGPSLYTDEILDILKEYGVKATFFVIGKKDSESKRLYQRIVEEGHTLGMHSYSHVYKQIYNSAEDFDKDFTKLWKLLYDTTGYMPTIYRFPGGSANKVNKHGMEEFIRYLKDKSIVYYDWNVDNGDATGNEFTKKQLTNNILDGVAAKKRSIVLMHDAQGKRTTVDSLPMVLESLILGGAEVLPLTEDVAPIQQIKAEDVK